MSPAAGYRRSPSSRGISAGLGGPSYQRRPRGLSSRTLVPRGRDCRGATLVETAVALSLFVSLLLGTVDLGYAVFRHHVLAHVARRVARQASVHGALADRLGAWGPDSISVTASDAGQIARSAAASLVGWQLAEVQIELEWVDGGNQADQGHRVRVRLSAPHQPMMTFLLGSTPIRLSATSTMRIAH